MVLLALYFCLSIVFSFLCSIWEAVLLSLSPSFVQSELEKGTSTGLLLNEFKEDVDRPLSAILTLNTIAHTVGAIGVGAQAAVVFGSNYFSLGPITLSYESIIAALMTLAILILSEIIPKTIGANNHKALAPFTARSLKFVMIILKPFVWLSQLITKGLKSDKTKPVLSRADITAMASVGAKTGALDEKESTIIKNLMRLTRLKVRSIMTPKTVSFMLQEDLTLEEVLNVPEHKQYSRIPIYSENRDDITGIVLKAQIYEELIEGDKKASLKSLAHPANFVSVDASLQEVYDMLVEKRVHLSAVQDEFGAVAGLVSFEDLFETLLGLEIVDESDTVIDMQALARESFESKFGASDDGKADIKAD